jgi:hypothetical protein
MADVIDNVAPDGTIFDITGTDLSIQVNFVDPGATRPTDHSALVLSPKLVAPQATPLSDMFNKRWNDPPPGGGKSLRDQAGDRIRLMILQKVPDAFAFTIDLPTSGTLRASAPPADVLFMSYKLGGCSVTASKPVALGADATVTATFGIEILIIIDFRKWPNMTPNISTHVDDLNVKADSALAVLADFFKIIDLSTVVGDPNPGAADPGLPVVLNQLLLDMTTPGVPAGIQSCVASIDEASKVLTLRLIHAVDAPPFLKSVDDSGGGPSLFHSSIGVDKTQVHDGETVTVDGQDFPPNRANRTGVTWTDTISGNIVRSEIDVSIRNAPANRTTIKRQRFDTANVFFAENLQPGTPVTLSVRDCDSLTCTPFSNVFTVTTGGADTVLLTLEVNNVGISIGTAPLGATGAFRTSFVVPKGTPAGLHRVSANVDDVNADTAITVLPDVQPLPAQLHQIDPATGRIISSGVFGSDPITLKGDGFQAADVAIRLDSVGGQQLATAAADASGTFRVSFRWPAFTFGQHTLFAVQEPQIASLSVFDEKPPS